MIKKVCIITGANSGIGKAAAIQIAQEGYRVIMACRNQARGEAALKEVAAQSGSESVELMIVDMSLQSSIRLFSQSVREKYDHVDVLIHNAADFDITRKEIVLTEEGIEQVWATNHLGPVLLTDLLMENLKNSQQGRVITISSKGLVVYPKLKVDLKDPEYRQRKFSVQNAYYQSKLAQVMYTYWLADQLKESEVTANCVRVTNVKIDVDERYPDHSKLSRWMYSIKSKFSISPEEMAKTYTYLAVSEDVRTTTGKYFDDPDTIVNSSPYSTTPENINALMDVTFRYFEDCQ